MSGKILVIDDDKDIGSLIQLAMQSKGYEVMYATSGSEGLTLFRQFGPDITLVDKRMPDMDGFEVARRIRETEAGKKTQLLLMTGSVTEYEPDKSLFAGMIEKPVSMARLGDVIGDLLTKA